jgi:acyl-CoA thioester hydrolase
MSDPRLIDVAHYRVLFADCDPMRIMYNGTYFRLFGIGWTELFRKLGQPLPGYIARGLFLAVIEAKCRYLKPSRYDDELIIRSAVTSVGAARLRIEHEIVRSGEVLARGTTAHAVVDEQNRPQRVPLELKHAAAVIQPRLTASS